MTKQVTAHSLSSCPHVPIENKCLYISQVPFSPIVLRPVHSLLPSPDTGPMQVEIAGLVVQESDDSPCRFGLLPLS